jgi:uncharacterized protein
MTPENLCSISGATRVRKLLGLDTTWEGTVTGREGKMRGPTMTCTPLRPETSSGFEDPASKPAPPKSSVSSDRNLETVRGFRRLLYLALAGWFFVLALLGAILPGLPTTPFLLLTSYFLVRTSPRLNAALLRSRFFGPILRDWQQHRGIRPHVKVQALLVVAITLGLTLYFSGLSWPLKGVILGLALIGVLVILRLPETP